MFQVSEMAVKPQNIGQSARYIVFFQKNRVHSNRVIEIGINKHCFNLFHGNVPFLF